MAGIAPSTISPPADNESLFRKFGKQIQKRQLEVPEYAASFVNYKALKKVRC
jgi:CDK inhibitor PHO81